MTDTLVRMSASRAAKFASCGEKYRLTYLYDLPQVPSVAAIGGKGFHEYAFDSELYRMGQINELPPFASYLERELQRAESDSGLTRDKFKVSGRKTKALPLGETIEYWRDELGPWMAEVYYKFDFGSDWQVATDLPPDPGGNTLGLEYEINLPDIPFVGYVDRIDVDRFGNYRVVDYKTGRKRKSTQLQLYMAALKILGVRAVRASYYYSRKAELDGPYPAAWSEQTFRDYLTVHQLAIKSELFVPNPGDQCGWCDVRDHCRFASGAV